jgi:hypothetical protein
MKTIRKAAVVTGTKTSRTGIMTVKFTNRKRNPVTVEIAFTSSIETKKAEKYFFIDGRTDSECITGLCDQFGLKIHTSPL